MPKQNVIISYLSGTMFAIGWWILIDSNVMSNYYRLEDGKVNGIHYIPAIASTLALILLNLLPSSAFSLEWSDFDEVEGKVKLGMLIGFLLAFGGIFGGTYLMIVTYLVRTPVVPPSSDASIAFIRWIGISVCLQNFLIFASTLAMRFGRKTEDLFGK